jgi:hypothetical protein
MLRSNSGEVVKRPMELSTVTVPHSRNRDNAVGIGTGYVSDGRGIVKNFFHVVQITSTAHLAPFPIATGGSFLGGKAA